MSCKWKSKRKKGLKYKCQSNSAKNMQAFLRYKRLVEEWCDVGGWVDPKE
jgi:hypothetical protein